MTMMMMIKQSGADGPMQCFQITSPPLRSNTAQSIAIHTIILTKTDMNRPTCNN